LACVLGSCLDADSCGPVDDAVQVSAAPIYLAEPPLAPDTSICVLNGQIQGNRAVLEIQQCVGMLSSMVIEIQPLVAPIEDLLGNPNLAASVTVVQAPEGFFARIDANGMDLYYIDGSTLFVDGITQYPWAIAPFSSACGTTPSMCGVNERLAMLVDDGVVFDGSAAQASDAATAWIEETLDVCGTNSSELALLAF
jgi:hypothetical protein